MKPTDFAKHLADFLTTYLSGQKNVSKNTICSYRDTFKLLLTYCKEAKGIAVENVSLKTLSTELIIDFLTWIECERNCSVATRNQRLASIHSFFRYVQSEEPAGIYHYQQVMSIPAKKTCKKLVGYLSPEIIKIILSQPDKNTTKGRRDLTLLSTLYDTGARVQEIIDIKVCDITLDSPAVMVLTGKGNKVRRVPLMKNTAALLRSYLNENCLNQQWKNRHSVFTNNQGNKLTREGIAHILKKYVRIARETSPKLPEQISPHIFRHSKAMHLLQAGINLIYIRDFLGHTDIKTTEIYATADTETKRQAIESAYPDLISNKMPDWSKDNDLLSWLSDLNK